MNRAELKNWVRDESKKIWYKFQQVSFWILLLILVGFYLGTVYANYTYNSRRNELIILGCFLNLEDGKVYNVTLDPSRSGKK